MRRFYIITAFLIYGFTTLDARANNPPGPMVSIPEITLLPIMMLVSLAAGYYSLGGLTKKNRAGESPKTFRKTSAGMQAIMVIFIILFSFAHEGFGILVALIFGGIALARAFRMIALARGKTSEVQSAGVQPMRLLIGGVFLAMVTLFLTGLAAAFFGYWPEYAHKARAEQLQKLTAFQIGYAREQQLKTGKRAFYRPILNNPPRWQEFIFGNYLKGYLEVEYAPGDQSYIAHVPANGRMPFFPYNYFTSQPAMQADDSGVIRMIRVHQRGLRCPADAPIVWRVNEADIMAVLEEIKSYE